MVTTLIVNSSVLDSTNQSANSGEEISCSGRFDVESETYTDYLQVADETAFVSLSLFGPVEFKLQLTAYETLKPTAPQSLSPPTLISPDILAELSDNTPTLRWDTVPGASSYNLEVYELSTGTILVDETVNSTSYTSPTLIDGQTYEWVLTS